jgi:hypothetical protein
MIKVLLKTGQDPGRALCDPLPVYFSQTPTPHKRFVANKRRSSIRPNGDRTVEAPFSRFSRAQSCCLDILFASRPTSVRQRVTNSKSCAALKTAALQTVIVSERRSREPNDLKQARILLAASCSPHHSHPGALLDYSAFLSTNQSRIRTSLDKLTARNIPNSKTDLSV